MVHIDVYREIEREERIYQFVTGVISLNFRAEKTDHPQMGTFVPGLNHRVSPRTGGREGANFEQWRPDSMVITGEANRSLYQNPRLRVFAWVG